jgi:hypothetical protein
MIRRSSFAVLVLVSSMAAPRPPSGLQGPAAVAPPQAAGDVPAGWNVSPAVDADWARFSAQWSSAPAVDARSGGARGDGRVATDCAIAALSATLTCARDRFLPSDAGKVIAVYGAGAFYAPHGAQPLSTRIAAVGSARVVTLANDAVTSVSPSSRVVWGTDDTAALQAALDSIAGAGQAGDPGGVLDIPAGHYLVQGLQLPCSRLGAFQRGMCIATYNRIWIRGQGANRTTLENWDVATPHEALVTLGTRAATPWHASQLGERNARLANIAITHVELRQVAHATAVRTTIHGSATEDVWLFNTRGSGHSYECYVMGGGENSTRWRVHYNEMSDCGFGGPAYPFSTSALNLNGMDWTASHNLVTSSGQAVEMGSRRGTLSDNVFVVPARGVGVNVGSSVAGIWSNTIARNRILGGGITVSNAIGTAHSTRILDNVIVNGSIQIASGQERNSVVESEADATIHGTSRISGNRITYDIYNASMAIQIGTQAYGTQAGLESVNVDGNRVEYRKTHVVRFRGLANQGLECVDDRTPGGLCLLSSGFLAVGAYGGAMWTPLAAYAIDADPAIYSKHHYVVPPVGNGYLYVNITGGTSGSSPPLFPTTIGATVRDGSVTWRNYGPVPSVVAYGNILRGPAGAVSGGRDFSHWGSAPGRLTIGPVDANFDWVVEGGGWD